MMGSLRDRKIGAVIGAAVADSAAQPMHWIYNHEKLDAVLADRVEIEYTEPSVNPFYRIQTGSQSCYGDQAFVLLESLVEKKGLDVHDFTERTYKMFGPDSAYDSTVTDKYVLKSDEKKIPINGPWRHASIKYFNKQMAEDKKDTGCSGDQQIDGLTKIAPLVALYAGQGDMLEKVEDAVRVTQDNDIAVTTTLAFARLLEYYILHGPDADAMNKVIANLLDPKRKNPQELDRHIANCMKDVLPRIDQPHREVSSKQYKIS